jgi:hypothetical protein
MSANEEQDALKRIEEITTMFEQATGWGSWMVMAANERERLVNKLNATGRYTIEHKWLVRCDGKRTG